ncbi:hypothetical protein ACIQBJ_09540 [Kitasatospora sp. NPDC088391]|uniref:hypothetical protein n=1 Tax=Kitasatospora sp. NPDC088391 TaxID=3364074 RepID=UPI00382B421B
MTDIESPEPAAEVTEPRVTPTEAPIEAPAEVPVEASAEAPAPVRTGPRRTALKAAAAVVAAALVGVGIGEVILRTNYRDDAPVAAAPAPAPSSSTPAPWGAKSNGSHFGSLRDLLLPIPAGYRAGPDYQSLGNDSELRGEALDKAQKDMLAEVPEKYRKNTEDLLSSMRLQGIGTRTLVTGDNRISVALSLRQFNQQWVAAQSTAYGAWYTDNELYRQGPGVAGHPDAHCALPALKAGDQLDFVQCYSAIGDLLVEMEVSGVAPLDQNKVVDLFRQQLDRLAIPGASV